MRKNTLTEELLISMSQEVGELPPDPENMNHARAESAFRAIRKFSKDYGENIDEFGGKAQLDIFEQNTSDLFGNLAHLCDRLGLDFGDLVRKAKFHYDAETENKGEQLEFVE